MRINNSMFYKSHYSTKAGSIYFYSSISDLRMICANSCSTSAFQFDYCDASQVNQVKYLSMPNCSHTPTVIYSIHMYHGIGIDEPSSCTSTYCTFAYNKLSDYRCIYLFSASETITMSYANIVHNNSPLSYICQWSRRFIEMFT